MSAIQTTYDKLDNIKKWCDWQDSGFISKIKSISDLEKLYDYCMANNLEFADNDYMNVLEDSDRDNAIKGIKDLLGYDLY